MFNKIHIFKRLNTLECENDILKSELDLLKASDNLKTKTILSLLKNKTKDTVTGTKNVKNTMTFSKEQAIKLLCCLENATYLESDEGTKTDISREQRNKLIGMSEDLSWDIANRYNIDVNDVFVDINTLEFKEY